MASPTRQRPRGRARRDMNPDDDEDDNGGRDNQKNPKRRETAHPNQSFACPYAKTFPVKHISCLKYCMKRIGDVKSHLQRHHMMPVHCPNCGLIFAGRKKHEDRASHIRTRTCASVNFHPLTGLSPEQMERLKDCPEASGPGSRYERRWFGLWNVLFLESGYPPPDTPYTASEFQERIDLAAVEVINDTQFTDFGNVFPVNRQDIDNFKHYVVQRFKRYAAEQYDTRSVATSQVQHPAAHIEQLTLRQQAGQLLGYDSFDGQAHGQMDDWDLNHQWNCFTLPGGTLTATSTTSLGPLANNAPNDNTDQDYYEFFGDDDLDDYDPSPSNL
ncbi:hypothetical protein B0T16DRAFT_178680 [Cercophora newfieldiana]|uniref:C2H2-type domain-containing protein n=1 Tax=Cercophora newfieldiana TaxID=92897 RepID=A0AA39XZK9_9PEZI|nr:hypothetical protein B0T16DRAFT_178680 [Cercophora newfieldiana]